MRFDGIYIQPGLVVALPSAMVAHLHKLVSAEDDAGYPAQTA